MKKNNYAAIVTDTRNRESIRAMVKNMVYEGNPQELDAYRKLVKSNVSIFRRTYLTGYLFKLLAENKGSQPTHYSRSRDNRRTRDSRGMHSSTRDGYSRRNERSGVDSRSGRRDSRDDAPGVPSVIDGVTSLHINCGRLHGVMETDLKGCLDSHVNADVITGIKNIRVYDRYLFIYIAEEHAAAVIQALNGVTLSNRRMTVSYSKKYIK